MFKVLVVVGLLICHVAANIDASSIGVPADTHKTGFGVAIPASSGLADEEQQQLQLVDVSPEDENQQSVNHVKEMFANAFNSIKSQRESIIAENSTPKST
ncbi:unnamed protein product [Caenorhabditis sp. 36 PRJEB53466]|nr:unnamed protein product [Caenorhabditis sp. 36 PRJEB53466]